MGDRLGIQRSFINLGKMPMGGLHSHKWLKLMRAVLVGLVLASLPSRLSRGRQERPSCGSQMLMAD